MEEEVKNQEAKGQESKEQESKEQESNEFDAIIILGGGIRDNLTLPTWTKARVEKALEVAKNQGTKFFIATSGCSSNLPIPLDDSGQPITDALVISKQLLDADVPKDKILLEAFSRETIGNAFLTRLMHTEVLGLKKLCIITNEFHMPRSKEIFEHIFSLKPLNLNYELTFITANDEGMSEEILDERRKKEERRVIDYIQNKRPYQTIKEFHNYFFTKHGCYMPFGELENDSEALKNSY